MPILLIVDGRFLFIQIAKYSSFLSFPGASMAISQTIYSLRSRLGLKDLACSFITRRDRWPKKSIAIFCLPLFSHHGKPDKNSESSWFGPKWRGAKIELKSEGVRHSGWALSFLRMHSLNLHASSISAIPSDAWGPLNQRSLFFGR